MKLKLTLEQWSFMESLSVEDRDYNQSEIDDIVIEALSDKLQRQGFTTGQQDVNGIDAMCESIIDRVEEQRQNERSKINY